VTRPRRCAARKRRYVALVATVPVVGADVGGTPVQFFFVGDSSTGSESPGSTARGSLAVRYPGRTVGRIAAAHVDGH
jgi:hypothetical protein